MEHLTEDNLPDIENYKGDQPFIIDFYADWCAPCKALTPVLEKLAKEYEGKVRFAKIDTEAEQTLAIKFSIRSIPTLVFVPNNGDKPKGFVGAPTKDGFYKLIKDFFDIDRPDA